MISIMNLDIFLYVILFIYKASQVYLTGFIDVIHILILDISILSL